MPDVPERLLDVGAVTAAPFAAIPSIGQIGRRQHEQASFRIEVTHLAALDGGGVCGEDFFAPRMIEFQS